MDNKKQYDVLISICVMLIFFGLLLLRMSWKLNLHFNNELIYSCNNIVDIYNNYSNEDMYYDDYIDNLNIEYNKLQELAVNNAGNRTDYVYTINEIQNDILALKDDDLKNDLNALNDVKHLVREHYFCFSFGLVLLVLGVGIIPVKIIVVKFKKKQLD